MQKHGLLFVAIDRTSKFAFVTLYEKADRPTAVRFLEALIAVVPYRLDTVLTENGIQFADLPKNRDGWTARYRVHRFSDLPSQGYRASPDEFFMTRSPHRQHTSRGGSSLGKDREQRTQPGPSKASRPAISYT